MADEQEITYPMDKRGLHIAHLNLQSINNKFDSVKNQIKQLNFPIFTFSVSWLSDHMINIQGYNLIRPDRQWKEDGKSEIKKGVVLVYI